MTTEKRELLNGVNSGIIGIRGAYAAWCSANGFNIALGVGTGVGFILYRRWVKKPLPVKIEQ